ncbi:MAG TPA: 6-phosphogluconolactonase [Candidatus Omnitrophota bacterium]|nr:6-phosphogluconolactonase [Candidatus Omnitrophota bacterium]
MDNRKILIFENSFTLTNFLLKEWVRTVNEAVEDHNRFVVALSGGKTPAEFYTRLSHLEEFDLWHKTHIFLADEHFVPYDDPESNFRMINDNLLHYVPIPPQNVHPIKTKYENVLIATEEYKHELIYFFELKERKLPRFDLIMLGMGEDGQVASLFPGEKGIDDPNRLTIPVSAYQSRTERVSLSLPVINNARTVVFIIQGLRKADMVKKVLEENIDVPAQHVHPADGRLMFLLDREAASRLSSPRKFTDHGEAISI